MSEVVESIKDNLNISVFDTPPPPKQKNIWYDMSMDDYLANEALGSSSLKKLIINPYEFKEYLRSDKKDTKATILGTAIHTAILEPNDFFNRYVLQPEDWGPKNKKPGKTLWDEFKKNADKNGKIPLGFEDAVIILKVIHAAKLHRFVQNLLKGAQTEVTAIANNGGYRLKARADLITKDNYIWDVKTTSQGMTDDALARTIFKEGYHFQAVHHSETFKKAGIPVKGFGWIFVSTNTAAVHIKTRIAGEKTLKNGKKDWDIALQTYEECLETDSWPGYDDEGFEIDLPEYTDKLYED
jgi:exodeoxyribonuclease VIII